MHLLSTVLAGGLLLAATGFIQAAAAELHLAGKWLTDETGQTLADPQSSGLTLRHGELVHIGDNSSAVPMRNILLRINPQTGQLIAPPVNITVASDLQNSCFAELLTNYPDWESLTWDREDDTTLVSVTEDSSDFSLSPQCAKRYSNTH